MNQQLPCDSVPKADCNVPELFTERNRYFTGKYMTARDFRDEQKYFLSHHQWHQWALHGWGIVWGLSVEVIENHCLRIKPGMAIDCHGRELVLPYAVKFAIGDLPETEEAQGQADGILIGLQFHTIQRDPVPVLLDDRDECSPPAKNSNNRILEWAKICVQKYCPQCWTYPRVSFPAALPQSVSRRPHPDNQERDAWDTLSLKEHNERDECGCTPPPISMKPPCECGDCGFVPLARLRFVDGFWKADDLGCRYVQSPFYKEALTHIVGINWNHGGNTALAELLHAYSKPEDTSDRNSLAVKVHSECNGHLGRIVITFDRALASPSNCISNDPTEVSTHLAQLIRLEYVKLDDACGDHDLDGDDPPFAVTVKRVQLSSCRKQLLCDFPSIKVGRDRPVRMRLSVNCDMLLDERGRAVDGDHIGGAVPQNSDTIANSNGKHGRSGDGKEGGLFYTWTTISNDQAY